MKRVIVFTGIGFGDQKELIQSMRSVTGWDVSSFEVTSSLNPEKVTEAIQKGDVFVLRAPWSGTFDDAAYAELLSMRCGPIFSELKNRLARGEKVKVFGIGRGANVLLRAPFEVFTRLRGVEWESMTVENSAWAPIKLSQVRGNFMGQVLGQYLPKISVTTQGNLQPWLVLNNGQIAGWNADHSLFVSWVDPFSYQHPSQLGDFGYIDYSHIQTCNDLLALFAEEWGS